jgi:hypothetical protein
MREAIVDARVWNCASICGHASAAWGEALMRCMAAQELADMCPCEAWAMASQHARAWAQASPEDCARAASGKRRAASEPRTNG